VTATGAAHYKIDLSETVKAEVEKPKEETARE